MSNRLSLATNASPVVLDIETCDLDNAADYLEPVQPDARLKDPEKIAADISAKTQARLEKLALDRNTGRIAALGWWTADSGDYCTCMCPDEQSEADNIERFWRAANHRTLIGFNVKSFDAPYLIQRSRYLGIPHPVLDLGKYSQRGVIDLYLMLTFNEGLYDQGAMRRTLKAFGKRFGLPVDDEHEGKDVPALVRAGDWDAVLSHLLADLRLTVGLAKRLGVLWHEEQPEVPR